MTVQPPFDPAEEMNVNADPGAVRRVAAASRRRVARCRANLAGRFGGEA